MSVFINQYSRLSYIHLQMVITSEETVQAKEAFERAKNQYIAYCGVDAHFQNSIAKKRIRDLQEATCTSLLFIIHKWPKMTSIHLWPYEKK